MKALATVGIFVTAMFLAGVTMADQSTNPYGYNFEPVAAMSGHESGKVISNPANDIYGYMPLTPSTTVTDQLNTKACPSGIVRLWDRIFAPEKLLASMENCPAPMKRRWL